MNTHGEATILRYLMSWFLLALSFLYAQTTVELVLFNPDAQIVAAGDLDLNNPDRLADLFVVELHDGGVAREIRLHIELRAGSRSFASAVTNGFRLPGDDTFFRFNGRNLAVGASFVDNQIIQLLPFTFDYAGIGIDNVVKNAGRLPAGIYNMVAGFQLLENGAPVGEVIRQPSSSGQITVTNPTTLHLQFPGQSVASNEVMEIATRFPLFQWTSDIGQNADRYNILVYEKSPDEETVQDVLSKPAILEIRDYEDSFFQYPANTSPLLLSGEAAVVRPLEAGRTYYWQVESLIPTVSGIETIRSDVFRFKISDFVGSDDYNYGLQVISILEQLLGSQHGDALEALREEGFDPNGKIELDDQQISINELIDILNQIANGEARVTEAQVY